LVVDDEPVFRRAARALLERRGYVVVGEAGSASEAEAAVGQLSPDALLLDVRLGDASGFDVAYALTRAYPKLAVLLSPPMWSTRVATNGRRQAAREASG
jgi:DNA-binding NarL/FixJ family response regulator